MVNIPLLGHPRRMGTIHLPTITTLLLLLLQIQMEFLPIKICLTSLGDQQANALTGLKLCGLGPNVLPPLGLFLPTRHKARMWPIQTGSNINVQPQLLQWSSLFEKFQGSPSQATSRISSRRKYWEGTSWIRWVLMSISICLYIALFSFLFTTEGRKDIPLKMVVNKHGQPYCKACQFYTHSLDDQVTYYLCFCLCFALLSFSF